MQLDPNPGMRSVLAALSCVGAVGVSIAFGADYHFLGDVIAGIYLGAVCGTVVMATLHAGWTEGTAHGNVGAGARRQAPPSQRTAEADEAPWPG